MAHVQRVSLPTNLFQERSEWYTVRVRYRFEKLVANALKAKDYEEYLPLYRKTSADSKRRSQAYKPLFSGYVFCRGDLSQLPHLVETPGVVGLLTFGDGPARIPDQEIQAIKTALQSGAQLEEWPYLHAGQAVRVTRGALAGIEGTLVSFKGECRMVLSIQVLCRSVALQIDRAWVSPIPGPTLSI